MSSGDVFRLVLAGTFTICMLVMLVSTLRFRRAAHDSSNPASRSTRFLVLSGVGVAVGLLEIVVALLL